MIEAPFVSLTRRYDIHPAELEEIAGLLGEDVLARNKAWICGGSVRRALLVEESSADIDVYAVDEHACAAVEARLVDRGFVFTKQVNHNKVYVYRGDINFGRSIRVDVSRRVFPKTPAECIAGFDYTVCQFALFYDRSELVVCYTNEALLDLVNGVLMPVKTGIPDGEQLKRTLRRARKYLSQGFVITHVTLSAFCDIAGELQCRQKD